MRRLEPALALAATLSVQAAIAGEAPALTAERQAELSNIVLQDCGSCHGLTLKGGLGRAITPSALSGFDTQTLQDIVLHGIPGTPMPPWAGLITPAEAVWIAEGLKQGRFQ